MFKHTQTICRQQLTNYSSMFDHFAGLALRGLKNSQEILIKMLKIHVKLKTWVSLFKEFSEYRLSDHLARNIYLQVFLQIAVPWILATSKIPY